ncbi:MAG: insulinase family protein, partial [Acutalibacteraceae bacterium]
EPVGAATDCIEETMSVDIPKFAIGFKETISSPVRTAKEVVCMNIALDIIAGRTSPLYNSLIANGLINPSFGSEYFIGRGFACPMFSGESKTPEKVRDAILKNIDQLKQNGIRDDDFNISRKRLYGLALRSFNDVDDIAGNIVDSYFNGSDLFEEIESYKAVTKTDIENTIKTHFDTDKMCLSVIK